MTSPNGMVQQRGFGLTRSFVLTAAAALAFFLISDPFAMHLAGINPAASRPEELKQYGLYLRAGVGAAAGAILLLRQRAIWPLLARNLGLPGFIFFCLFSCMWSEDPYLAIRTSFIIVCGIVVALAIAAYLEPRQYLTAMLWALSASILLSVFWAMFVPQYGVHQFADVFQGGHVGKWRGIYRHKNLLGQVAGMAIALFAVVDRREISPLIRWPTMALAVLCLWKSQSASGLAIAVTGIAAYYGIFVARGFWRLIVVVVVSALLLVSSVYGPSIATQGLHALGRDATLTGRIYIWEAGLREWGSHFFLGQGIAAFSKASVTSVFAASVGLRDVGDPHNAYLYVAVSLGTVGLCVFGLMVLRALQLSTVPAVSDNDRRVARFFTITIIAWLAAGVVESSPLTPGSTLSSFGFDALIGLTLFALSHGRSRLGMGRIRAREGTVPVSSGQARAPSLGVTRLTGSSH